MVAAVADPREAAACAKRLTAPIMARAARHAARAEATGELPSALAAELKLFASACVSWSFPGSTRRHKSSSRHKRHPPNRHLKKSELEHPALAALGEAWPTLVAFTAEPWRSVPAVADATCAVFQKALLSQGARRRRRAAVLGRSGTRSPRTTTLVPGRAGDRRGGVLFERRRRERERERTFARVVLSGVWFVRRVGGGVPLRAPNRRQGGGGVRALRCAHKIATFAPFVFLNATHGNAQDNQPTRVFACHTALSVAVAALSTRERDATRAATALLSVRRRPASRRARALGARDAAGPWTPSPRRAVRRASQRAWSPAPTTRPGSACARSRRSCARCARRTERRLMFH